MDGPDSPTLEVGFAIDTGGSFESLAQLQQVMGSTEAKIVAEAASIERATSGMLNLGGATAQVKTFSNATTQAGATAEAAFKKATAAGEALNRQQQYQIETFGMSRAAAKAYFAELAGNSELAERLRRDEAALIALREKSVVGLQGVTKGSNQMRFAMQGASYQVQDLFTQLSMGANPLNALAIQGGQLAGQFSNVENKAGAIARFFIGPWGLAITAAALVLGPFLSKLIKSNDALGDAVDKLKADAAQTDVTRRAKDAFAHSVEGVEAAIRDQKAALDDSIKSLTTAAERANMVAKANLAHEISIRNVTKAMLEQALAQEQVDKVRSQGPGQRGELGTLALDVSTSRAAALQQALTRQTQAVTDAERNLNRTRVSLAVEVGKQVATTSGRITRDYDQQIKALQRTADAQAIAGKTIDSSLTNQIKHLEMRKQAAIDAANAQDKLNKSAVAGDTASAARVAALLRRTMPGVQITSTTGGKHVNGSDHYKNQAIDFVPAGGMGSMTKSDVRSMVEKMGLQIRRNQKGTEQLFGPGDKGHSDHFHIAWEKSKVALDNYAASLPAAEKAIREQKAAYDKAVQGAHDYADAQNAIARQTTLSAKEQRAYADAVAIAAAVTEKDKQAIRDAAATREAALSKADATAFQDNVIKPLQDELALYGLVGPAREKAALELEKDGFIAKNMGDGLVVATQRWNEYHAAKMGLITRDAAADAEAASIQRMNEQLSMTASLMETIDGQAQGLANSLGMAFGGVGQGIGEALTALTSYAATQANLDAQHHADQIKYKNDAKLMADADVLYSKRSGLARQQATMQAIGGVKSLFNEHSKAYKVMSAIEKAYAAWQAAETIASIARDVTKTVSHLINSGTRTAANTAEGGSKIFAELGPWAFPVVAAMVAVLAALGAKGGGGGGSSPSIPSAEDMQARAGTGTVLGDTKAKSESIARSLEIVAANTNSDLEYSNQMLIALRSIDTSIAKMAGTVARQIQVSGSLFDTSKLGLGETAKKGFLGLIGGSSTSKTLLDLGINLGSGSVADIIANGISGSTYQTIQKVKTKSGFLGIGGGTKTTTSTTTGAIDGEITAAIQDVIRSLRNGLVAGADVIGLAGAQAILDSFQVSIGQISFKDMTGQEIEDQLNAIFSSVGDQMAGALLPSLSSMQQVGEGLFETFSRVAREYQVVDVALQSIGKTFGEVGVNSIVARDALVQLFGGLDAFAEATSFFREHFLSEADQIAPVIQAVATEMVRLGMTGVSTRDQFKAAVLGLDLTTAAGREMYASMLAVAPAFDKVISYFDQANKATIDGLKSTADQFNGFAESLAKYRDTLFATDVAQGSAYEALRAKFLSTASSAATGDATALGGLEGAGKAFLDSARNNASTHEQYLQDVAIVARSVDAGIFAAKETVDYAQLQVAALNNANQLLTAIAAATAAAAAALGSGSGPVVLPPAPDTVVTDVGTAVGVTTPPVADPIIADLRDGLFDLREALEKMRIENNAGLAATAGNTGRVARVFEDLTAESGGLALSVQAQ